MNTEWLATAYLPAGLGIGLLASAPMGPVNILVIQSALQSGRKPALLLGFGSALGDLLFATIAALGIGVLISGFTDHREALRLIGGAIMIAFAGFLWFRAPHLQTGPAQPQGKSWNLAIAAFAMTITNPVTLLWFASVFGTVGFVAIGHSTPRALLHSLILVSGVFIGAMGWWVLVTGLTRRYRHHVNDRMLAHVNHGIALIMLASGVYAVADSLMHWQRLQ